MRVRDHFAISLIVIGTSGAIFGGSSWFLLSAMILAIGLAVFFGGTVLFSLGVSVVMSIIVFLFWRGESRNIEELPFIAFGVMLMFPFVWFISWLISNAVVWWREIKGGRHEDVDSAQDSGDADVNSKRLHKSEIGDR